MVLVSVDGKSDIPEAQKTTNEEQSSQQPNPIDWKPS